MLSALLSVLLSLLLLAASFLAPQPLRAQGGSDFLLSPTIFFGQENQSKLILLSINAEDVSSVIIEQIEQTLQRNLANLDHFFIAGPRELEAFFANDRPALSFCNQIDCGMEAARTLESDFLIVTQLTRQGEEFLIKSRFIDVIDSGILYEEESIFTKETMEETLFNMIRNIYQHTELQGKVLEISRQGVMVDLGSLHGLAPGDSVVLYRQKMAEGLPQENSAGLVKLPVAVITLYEVGKRSSLGRLLYSMDTLSPDLSARSYAAKDLQIHMVDKARSSIDTAKRFRPKDPVALSIKPIEVSNEGQDLWQVRLKKAEGAQFMWGLAGLGSGLATLFFIQKFSESDQNRLLTLAAGAGAGYSLLQYLRVRQLLDEIRVEGRTKGYLGFDPLHRTLAFSLRF